jgi:hypothetical protein
MTGSDVSRRALLRRAAGLGLAAAVTTVLPGCGSGRVSESACPEGPPETTTIRLIECPLECFAAQAAAADYLEREGFTEVDCFSVDPREQSRPARRRSGARGSADGTSGLHRGRCLRRNGGRPPRDADMQRGGHLDTAKSLSFCALHLKDAGLISGTPEHVISRGTDFRYGRKLRQELRTT